MSKNPLKGYYLTRIYKGDDPFATIMDLVRDDAIEMCRKMTPHRRAGPQDVEDPHAAIYDARIGIEDWLRDYAQTVGVDTKEQHPVYFALTKEPEPANSGRRAISIPAEKVDLSRCSFTFDDSFINHASVEGRGKDYDPHPLRGVVLNAEQTAAAVKQYGMLGNYDKGSRYIEVQMWDRPKANDPQIKPRPPQSRFKP